MSDGQTYLAVLNELKAKPPCEEGQKVKASVILNRLETVRFGTGHAGDVFVDEEGVRHHAVTVLHGGNAAKTVSYLFLVLDREQVMRAHHVLTLDATLAVVVTAELSHCLRVVVDTRARASEAGLVSRLTLGRDPSAAR